MVSPSPYCRSCTKAQVGERRRVNSKKGKPLTPIERLLAALDNRESESHERTGYCEACGDNVPVVMVRGARPGPLCRPCWAVWATGRHRTGIAKLLVCLAAHNANQEKMELAVGVIEERPAGVRNLMGREGDRAGIWLEAKARAVLRWTLGLSPAA